MVKLKLKPISKKSIPKALKKVERYRLLNDPIQAESICRDILDVDPENQEALIMFILALTDASNEGISSQEAKSIIPRLVVEYDKAYYSGIILERKARAALSRGYPESKFDAYEWLEDAMEAFERADQLKQEMDNDDPILRYNSCVRTIEKYNLSPRVSTGGGIPPPLE